MAIAGPIDGNRNFPNTLSHVNLSDLIGLDIIPLDTILFPFLYSIAIISLVIYKQQIITVKCTGVDEWYGRVTSNTNVLCSLLCHYVFLAPWDER